MKAAFSIFLVGMMGAGKSTVGVRLARRLGRAFIDADRELEERLGVSIPTIFELEGEEGFRRRETQLLDELSARDGLVLATGGGAILSPANRDMLRTRGRVVYLQASAADLWQRLRRDRHRPLLRTANPRERIHRLTSEREPLYLVEGDSAGGSAKQGRDHKFQAILPLKGKILNVERARFERMLASQEVATLITALGTSIGKEEFNLEKLRYHRIIIMTDADVDGAHIRTLLLTFFYRQMPELVERGYIYIAQPPLYKAKAGKQERYLKDEQEKDEFLLGLAVDKAKIVSGSRTIEGAELLKLAKQFLYARNTIAEESRVIDAAVLRALIDIEPISLDSEANAKAAVAALSGSLHNQEVALEYVAGHDGGHFVKITRQLHGNVMVSYLDQKFVDSKAYQVLRKTAEQQRGLIGKDGAALYKGEGEPQHVATFEEALDSLLQSAQKGMTIQRYKGLGEMNPEQLWETTMDPAVRRLLKVRIEDAIAADETFVTLMGDEVEPRRAFIETNALVAQNIDA